MTFDDGYRDNLLAAAPVLAEFEIPATVFVPSRIIDGDVSFHWYEDPPPALSWAEVGELIAGGAGRRAIAHAHPPAAPAGRCTALV